jgi:dolichol kinase
MPQLDTLDSIMWTIGLVLVSLKSVIDGELFKCYALVALMTFSWLLSILRKRPMFRQNADAQVVGGLLSIPTALFALDSKFQIPSICVALTLCLIFLLSKKPIPTRDLKFTIPITFIIPWFFFFFSDESIVVLSLTNYFAVFVINTLLNHARESFTIGEAMLVSNLAAIPIRSILLETELPQFCATFIVGAVFCLCLSLLVKRPIAVISCILPLFITYKNIPFIISFLFSFKRILILGYCGIVCVVFILASVFWKGLEKMPQIIQRKFFHIMALLVFIVPVIVDVEWMRLAISGAIYVFLVFESLRIVRFPFIAKVIEQYISDFIDERDSGELILTHLFLLMGCGLPVMFCDMDGYNGFAVKVCGISVLAIGDAAASAIGIKYGKHKWPGSKKSIEGTLGAFFGTWITIVVLTGIGTKSVCISSSLILAIPSLVGALDEAFTSQIDNLTLPFVILPFVVLCLQLVK